MTDVRPLAGIRACVFDAYGTLFDFASAATSCADSLGAKADSLTALWRDKQLQYTWLRAAQNRHADFWQVTGDALDYALAMLQIADEDGALRQRLMSSYRELDTFPEVATVLRRLKSAGFPTGILSNGSPEMLATAVSHAGIDGMLDHVLSVEEVGVYKPAPAVYRLAVERLGVPASAIAFPIVECLGHSRRLGFRHAHGVVQSQRTAARAAARRSGPGGQNTGRASRAFGGALSGGQSQRLAARRLQPRVAAAEWGQRPASMSARSLR
jgi:2-haloacid dehalogenase